MVRKTKEEAQETRSAILDAAELVFKENGVSRTSLAEIATAAGVTRGAVYWHFKNKADLFDAMIQRVFGMMEEKLAELQCDTDANPVDSLGDLARHFVDRVANDPRYFRLLEISWHKCEYVGEMARSRDKHLECGNRYLSFSEEVFQLAKARGYLPASLDSRQAAIGLMAVVDGLIVNWTLDPSVFPLANYGPGIINTYLTGLRMVSDGETKRPRRS